MALNNAAVVTAARGYIFTAPEGTPAPTPAQIDAFNPTAGFSGWDNVGHTSADDLPEFGFDGGDTSTKGTWQNASLRTIVTDPPVDSVKFTLMQFDENALSLYYGQANSSGVPDIFRVSGPSSTPTRKALLIVIVDGGTQIAFWAPSADVVRSDSISLATDDFGGLPVQATLLQWTGELGGDTVTVQFDWISSDTGVSTATGS